MKDSRQQREMLITFLIAGLGAVAAEHFFGPVIKRKVRK